MSISGWSLEKVGGRGFPEISTDLSSLPSMFDDLGDVKIQINPEKGLFESVGALVPTNYDLFCNYVWQMSSPKLSC